MDTKDNKRKGRAPSGGRAGTAVKPRKKQPQAKRPPDSEIVYTQPKPFDRSGFLLRLLTVVAVVLALTLGMSIFFKVSVICVSGNEKYSEWEVRQASGIADGENLLTLSKAQISGRLKTALPYVDTVRIGIKLPDTVNIEITELAVTYAIEADDGTWWLMDSAGRLLESVSGSQAKTYTQVLGVQVTGPQVGAQSVAAEEAPQTVTQTNDDGETVTVTVPQTVLGSERLGAAVSILQYLEDNGILGEVASVDVTSLNTIQLWYGTRYQVNLGTATELSYKLKCMKQTVAQMSQYQTGILDISFTLRPDEVVYSAFEQD